MAQVSLDRKKELQEPDEFQKFMTRALAYFNENKKWVISVAALMSAVIVIASVSAWAIRNRQNTASIKFTDAFTAYETTKEKDPAAAYLAHAETIQKLLDQYGGTKAAAYARIRLAGMAADTDAKDTALELYTAAWQKDGSNPAFRNMILTGLAYAYEAKGDTANAISQLRKIADGTDLFQKDQALYNLGRLYEAAGDAEKSQAAWQALVDGFSDSIYYPVAVSRLAG